jgi:hypothetical protein
MTTILSNQDFTWKGLALHLGKSRTPVLWLEQDEGYRHLYRIRYPSGWRSTPGNLTRAKDAAYGHARHLLAQQTARKAPSSPEAPLSGSSRAGAETPNEVETWPTS